jgi:lambda repressor-like predicted transcriptional regulator
MDAWTRGFLCGWCMAWQSQPFLDEQASEEAETLAAPAPRKRRTGTRASVPTYPNALRSCIKQAGYSFREVSRETAIPESTLYSWASGKQVIPHASREQLAQVIGCAVEELAPKRLGVSG